MIAGKMTEAAAVAVAVAVPWAVLIPWPPRSNQKATGRGGTPHMGVSQQMLGLCWFIMENPKIKWFTMEHPMKKWMIWGYPYKKKSPFQGCLRKSQSIKEDLTLFKGKRGAPLLRM